MLHGLLKEVIVVQLIKTSPASIEDKVSLVFTEGCNCTSCKLCESSPHPHTLFL